MPKRSAFPASTWRERLRARVAPRAVALGMALLIEAVLLLLLLSLNQVGGTEPTRETVVDFTASNAAADEAPEPEPTPAAQSQPAPAPVREPPPQAAPSTVAEPLPAPSPVPVVPISRLPTAPTAPPAARPAPPAPVQGPAYGPPAPSSGGAYADSARVGTAPNGEPMYAAAWYRKPGDDELRGYLSTASGPGWALIACKTVPDFRVEDCVGLDEYPQGSQIMRAILAAAWQFRVRPPMKGGASLVGSWVRIRIDYDLRRQAG